jgi:molybdopterin-guanine dinucleotide biosynthesis protein A
MTLTAVLFVGGRSQRMGADKATLTFRGEPLWARQLRTLRALRPEALWVSAGAHPVWCPKELTVVLDEPPSRGPLSGLAAALARLETSHLLALAVDLPRMTPEILARLWTMARRGCGVVPRGRSGFESLCAIYPADAARAAGDLLSGKDVSLRRLVRQLLDERRVEIWDPSEIERGCFENLNTPGDLQQLRRAGC